MFYIDDILVFYYKNTEKEALEIIASIKQVYELREIGDIKYFLRVRIIRDRDIRKV